MAELKKAQESGKPMNQPSAEELAQREQYLKEQREKLKQVREQQRAQELQRTKAAIQDTSKPLSETTNAAEALGQQGAQPKASSSSQNFAGLSEEEQRELRLQFARRHKEEILAQVRLQQQQHQQSQQ